MVRLFARRLFGTANERVVRQYADRISAINSLEKDYEKLSHDELKLQTDDFRSIGQYDTLGT